MVPLTVPEIRRLLLVAAMDSVERDFRLGWSRWRRAHQAVARRCHIARGIRRGMVPMAPVAPPPVTRAELTDAEWEQVRSLLPPQRPARGRPRHDNRTVLGGILWVLRTASPWREMPARFGKWETAYARYRLWAAQGLWQRLIDALGPAESLSPMMNIGTEAEVSL